MDACINEARGFTLIFHPKYVSNLNVVSSNLGRILRMGIKKHGLKFNPGLALIGLRTTVP